MCSRLCSEVNGRWGEIQKDFTRHFKRTLPVISKRTPPVISLWEMPPSSARRALGSLSEGAVSCKLTEGVTLAEGVDGATD